MLHRVRRYVSAVWAGDREHSLSVHAATELRVSYGSARRDEHQDRLQALRNPVDAAARGTGGGEPADCPEPGKSGDSGPLTWRQLLARNPRLINATQGWMPESTLRAEDLFRRERDSGPETGGQAS